MLAFTLKLILLLSYNVSKFDADWEKTHKEELKHSKDMHDKLSIMMNLRGVDEQPTSDMSIDSQATLLSFYAMLFLTNDFDQDQEMDTKSINCESLRCADAILKDSKTLNHISNKIQKIALN